MYDSCIKLASEHSQDICMAASRIIQDKKVGQYAEMPLEDLASRLGPALAMQLRYLQSGDLDEWRRFCIQIISERMGQGLEYTNVIEAGQNLVAALEKFFQERLSGLDTIEGQPAGKALEGLLRRLQGLNTVATTTVMAYGMQHKK